MKKILLTIGLISPITSALSILTSFIYQYQGDYTNAMYFLVLAIFFYYSGKDIGKNDVF